MMKLLFLVLSVITTFHLFAGIYVSESGPWLRSNALLIYDGTRPVPKTADGKYKIPDWAKAIYWIAYENCPHLSVREDYNLSNYEIPSSVEEINAFATVVCSLCHPPQETNKESEPLAGGFILLQDEELLLKHGPMNDASKAYLVYHATTNQIDALDLACCRYSNKQHNHVHRLRLSPQHTPPTTVIVPEGVTTLGGEAMMDLECEGVIGATIILPESLTTIDDYAFTNEQLEFIREIKIPKNVVTINKRAFFSYGFGLLVQPGKFTVSPENPNLASLNDNLCTKDGKTLLVAGSSDLKTIVIPKSITTIPLYGERMDDVFALHSSVDKILVEEGNQTYSSRNGYLCSKDGKCLIKIPTGIKDIRIPDGITTISENAFPCSTRINSITYQSGIQIVDTIGEIACPLFDFLSEHREDYCRDCHHAMNCGKIYLKRISDPEQTGDSNLIKVEFIHRTWDEICKFGDQFDPVAKEATDSTR